MANTIMASSSKSIITSPPTPKPKQPSSSFQFPQFPQFPTAKPIQSLSISTKSIAAAAAALVVSTPLPSLAEAMEKAALFDFDLTLPCIVAEFVFLMVVLDKIYYTPLGEFMDKRDAEIKEKLNSVKDTSAEVKQLEEQAAAIMRAAKAEIAAALNKMKDEATAEVEAKLAEGRKKVEAELEEALASLEKQKAETLAALNAQIEALSQEIVEKVLPAAATAAK